MRDGDLVAGRYRIGPLAGRGCMGSVHRALDLEACHEVAMKTLRGDAVDESARERFEHEGLALDAIDHPAVVRYRGSGTNEDGDPFLVMDWVEGATLSSRLRTLPLPSLDDIVGFGTVVADALAVCHARGVVHRDLKPGNVMLSGGAMGSPVLVDFGLARFASAATLTGSGARLGTPRFMAPEQIRDPRGVDGRADVFSLGCVLFECVTGVPAFGADDAMAVMARILLERAPRVAEIREGVPAALAALIDHMLAQAADDRPAAGEVRDRLATMDLEDRGPTSLSPLPEAAEPPREARAPSVAPDPSFVVEEEFALGPGEVGSFHPNPMQTWIGRAATLSIVEDALEHPGALVCLWGPPGIGKTRLTIEVLERQLRRTGRHGSLWLSAQRAHTRADLRSAVARQLGIGTPGDETAEEQFIVRALRARARPVLVADSVDHLGREIMELCAMLRERVPAFRAVVTSRERLDVPGAVHVEVGPLRREEAFALFVARAEAEAGCGSLEDAATGHVKRIVDAAGGFPLAIELMAARADVTGVEALAAELVGRAERDASGGGPPTTARGDTMRDALAWSWEQLDDESRRALACCAVFPASFDTDAACSVIGTTISGSAAAMLAVLRRKAFLALERGETAGTSRFVMLAPIRSFVLQRRTIGVSRADVRERHCAFYAGLARTLSARTARDGSLEAARSLEREEPQLTLALDHALAGERPSPARALDLAIAMEHVAGPRGEIDRVLTLLERVSAAAAGHDELFEPLACVRRLRARALGTRGRAEQAIPDLERWIHAARERGARHVLGGLLLDLGLLHHGGGALADAEASYRAACEALAEEGLERDEARALGNLGALLHDRGERVAAHEHYREATALLRTLGDLRMHGIFLMNLALLEQELGRREDARRHYEEARSQLEAYRDVRWLGVTLGNAAALDLEEGDARAALRHFEMAHALLARTGDARSEGLCLARMAGALACLGRVEDAEARVVRAERLLVRCDPLGKEVTSLQRAFIDLARAEAALARGDREDARAELGNAEARIAQAAEPSRGVAARSDDVRTALRSLRPRVEAVRSRLSA